MFENDNNSVTAAMNYLGVAKREVKVEHEEQVRDGWVKLSRDGSGNLVQKFGKELVNEYLIKVEQQDEIDKANELLNRHEQYDIYDTELYHKDYINSWDTEDMSESDESSDENNDEDNDDEVDDEMGDY
tara:strand:- start:472 stop:858 length:387 start_codon:yes stop_codon:yes gene_type:complete